MLGSLYKLFFRIVSCYFIFKSYQVAEKLVLFFKIKFEDKVKFVCLSVCFFLCALDMTIAVGQTEVKALFALC